MEVKNEKLNSLVQDMDPRYRRAHRRLAKIEEEMGSKDFYFILKGHYKNVSDETVYTPIFKI